VLELLFQSSELVAVNKPPGIASTGRTLDDPNCVQWMLSQQLQSKVWAVHQLDKDTSGVNLFVLRANLVEPFQQQLASNDVRKTYLAICHGRAPFERKRISAPIGPSKSGSKQVVREDGKPATTDVVCISRTIRFSALRCAISTGRTHQVRVHLAHIGHPLVGERRYRKPGCDLLPRHALHAVSIKGLSAVDAIAAPPPSDLSDIAELLTLELRPIGSVDPKGKR